MITSFIRSLTLIVSRPFLAVPAILSGLFNFAVLGLFMALILQFFQDVLVYGVFFGSPLDSMPLLVYANYASQINILVLTLFCSMVFGFWLAFVYGKYCNDSALKKAKLAKAIGYGFKNFGKIIMLSMVSILLIAFVIAISWFAMLIAMQAGLLGAVIAIVWVLSVLYAGIKIAFVVPAMAVDEIPLKDALKKSWEFTGKSFIKTVLFLLVAGIIGGIISNIGLSLSGFFPESQDFYALAIMLFFVIISSAYSNIAFNAYYLSIEHNRLP